MFFSDPDLHLSSLLNSKMFKIKSARPLGTNTLVRGTTQIRLLNEKFLMKHQGKDEASLTRSRTPPYQ